MSLITRCPTCGTMFKVVPDQLKVSEGWVRCGHCAEVFDATAHLHDGPVEPARAVADTSPGPIDDPVPSSGFSSSIHTEVGDEPSEMPPDSEQLAEEARALHEDALDRPFELNRPSPIAEERARAPEPDSALEPDLHDLTFVQQARRKAFWARPGVRVLLALAFLVLAGLLALQVAVNDRDQLAATQPQLRPWLARLCEPLRCTLGAPRQIESIAIDSSTFNKLRTDTYRLAVTLKSQAPFEVALPALELTLTDGQDQAVIRRVLAPSEFAPGAKAIAPGAEWTGAIALTVSASGGASRIAGYRLLAFYP